MFLLISDGDGIGTDGRSPTEAEMQQLIVIASDIEEEIVDVIPLKTKVPIINWKTGYHGKTSWWDIVRAGGKY